jgi:hypothetical protein
MNTFGWIEALKNNFRYAARRLRRNPGFAAVAILTLPRQPENRAGRAGADGRVRSGGRIESIRNMNESCGEKVAKRHSWGRAFRFNDL